MIFSTEDIENWDRVFRLKLINSITGYKSVHLVGTQNKEGLTNLGLFSSIFHISSSPALIGLVIKPNTVPRHTLDNIRNHKHFTINMVQSGFIDKAHFTSANWDNDESEFKACALTPEEKPNINAPFVKESEYKIACELVEETILNHYNSHIIVGKIIYGIIPDHCIEESGQLDLEKINAVTVTGLNQYSTGKKLKYIEYARVEDVPNFYQKQRPDNIAFDDNKQTYNSHVLPYGSNVSAPVIASNNISNWHNTSINKFNHVFNNKVEKIKREYDKLLAEFEVNELLYKATMNFEPIVGEVYHLYSDGSEKNCFLSIIPPNNWNKEHLGSFMLDNDRIWKKITDK